MAKKKAATPKSAARGAGPPDAEVRALARRRKELGEVRLKVAALLGHPAAIALVGLENVAERMIADWASRLALGHEVAVREALALVELGRDRRLAPPALHQELDRTIELARAWLACPCPDHAEVARAWLDHIDEEHPRWGYSWLTSAAAVIYRHPTLGGKDRVSTDAYRLFKRTSAKVVTTAIRGALLPWALGEADPAGGLGARRIAALKREGAAILAAAARKRGPTYAAPLGDSGARLTWNGEDQQWTGSVKGTGGPVQVTIVSDDAEPDESIAAAWPIVKKLLASDARLRRHAAKELLESANEWSEDGPVRQAQFMERMELEGFTVYTNGTAEVFYRDGGLFAGHWIVVGTDEKGRPDDASIGG
jgi:hypothetical protein